MTSRFHDDPRDADAVMDQQGNAVVVLCDEYTWYVSKSWSCMRSFGVRVDATRLLSAKFRHLC